MSRSSGSRRWRAFTKPLLVGFAACALGAACSSEGPAPHVSARDPELAPTATLPPSVEELVARTRMAFEREGTDIVSRRTTYRASVDPNGVVAMRPSSSSTALRLATTTPPRSGGALLDVDGSVVIEHGAARERLHNVDSGVEQSWELFARPSDRDLVVRVETNGLSYAGETAKGHHFVDPTSRRGVRYGSARWVDTKGDETPIATAFDGHALVMTVPSSVLDRSSYPARLDPILEPELEVDTPIPGPTGSVRDAKLVPGPNGTFLATWYEFGHGTEPMPLYAARIGADGKVIGSPFVVFLHAADATAAWDSVGERWLVAAVDGHRNGTRFARIAKDGTLLDPVPKIVPGTLVNHAAVAFDGAAFLVAFNTDRTLRTVRVNSATGAVDTASTLTVTSDVDPNGHEVACASPLVGCAVLWRPFSGGQHPTLTRISNANVVLDPNGIDVAALPGNVGSIASDGNQWLASWTDGYPARLKVARVSAVGTVSLSAQLDAASSLSAGQIAWDGTNFATVWAVGSTGSSYVRAQGIAPDGSLLGTSFTTLLTPQSGVLARNAAVATSGSVTLAGWAANMGPTNPLFVRPCSLALSPLDIARPVTVGANTELAPTAAFNGSTYLVAWLDYRDAPSPVAVYAARLSQGGAPLDAVGTRITSDLPSNANNDVVSVASDGNDFLLAWTTRFQQVAALRIAKTGAIPQAPSPLILATDEVRSRPSVAFDGQNYVVVWESTARVFLSGSDILAARVSPAGVVLDPEGFAVSSANGDQQEPAIASDGSVSFVAWTDRRVDYYSGDLYGARVARDGTVLDSNGIVISTRAMTQRAPAVAPNGAGFTVVWEDTAASAGNANEVYAARVDKNGAVVDPAPVRVATGGDPHHPAIVDMRDGVSQLVAWTNEDETGNPRVMGAWLRLGTTLDVVDPTPVALSASGGWAQEAAFAPTSTPGRVALFYSRYDPALNGARIRSRFVSSGSAVGTACTASTDCQTRFCIDQTCCNEACAGPCRRCGAGGACEAVLSADDPDTCNGENTCDATGACKKRNGQVCAQGSDCASGFCVDSFCCNTACDGACDSCTETRGTCTPLARGALGTPSCSPNRCDGQSAMCPTTCTADEDCADGFACDRPTKTCISGAVCIDIQTVREATRTTQSCAPYACRGGKCAASCKDVTDCAFPAVCDGSGRCVSPPDAAPLGCSTTPGPNGNAPVLSCFLTTLVLAIARARRKRQDGSSEGVER